MVQKGKLIVLEGTDGSGKATQTQLLSASLGQDGIRHMPLSFPRYGQPSAKLIEMYLRGEFGEDVNELSPYEVSKYYAIDRYASYKEDWGAYYNRGGVIICDRYTTSNAIHQASKLPKKDREAYFKWLYELEFTHMGLPTPDLVVYLDVPLDVTVNLMRAREKATNTQADIHEKDLGYLALCKETAQAAVSYYGWVTVACSEDGVLRSIGDIQTDIYSKVQELFK